MNGRKRHSIGDTEGLLLEVAVLAADVQDRDAALDLFAVIQPDQLRLACLWADGSCRGGLEDIVAARYPWKLGIVHTLVEPDGLVVLPRRWVVERTFAWLGRYRRLSKDYEKLNETSEAWIFAAMIQLMLRRLAA